MNTPLISIITPSYNLGRYLALTADSILAQTYTNWRWLIIDDGSKDNSVAVAQSYAARDSRITFLQKPNSGAAETRNLGISLLPKETQYVIFMDSDDLYTPHALQLLLEAAQQHPDNAGAHGVADYIDGKGQPLHPGEFSNFCRQRVAVQGAGIAPLSPNQPTTMASMLVKSLHPPGLFIIRRDILDRLGGFDKETSPQEDWDFWLRAARFGNFHFVDQLILYYRKHDTNASLDFTRSYRKAHFIRYKTFYSPDNTPEQKDLLKRYYRAWQIHKIREKSPAIPVALKHLHLPRAAKLTAHIAAHSLLYLRGHPTPAN